VIKKTLPVGILVATLFAANGAFAGMASDAHGNVGYDSAAECSAAVNAGTAKFYKPYTHKRSLLRAGEKRVQVMPLKELINPQNTAKYTQGACDVGVGRKAGRDGVAKILQGKYVPYSPDMLVNVYFSKQDVPVRATMSQCDNRFGGAMPSPTLAAPVAAKPAPTQTSVVTPKPTPAVVAPVAKPATVTAAMTSATGAIGYREMLGAAGVLAVGAILIHNHGDSGTTGSTGSQ
jgi:hypothetical protein